MIQLRKESFYSEDLINWILLHWDAVLSETSASWTKGSGVEAGIAVGLAVEDGTFRFVDNFPGAEGRVIAKSRDHGLMYINLQIKPDL